MCSEPLESDDLGPMARASLAATVRDQTAEALAKGARALVDEKAFPMSRAGAALSRPADPHRSRSSHRSPKGAEVLKIIGRVRCNVLISGGTGWERRRC